MRGSWTVRVVVPLVLVCACKARSLETADGGGTGSIPTAGGGGAGSGVGRGVASGSASASGNGSGGSAQPGGSAGGGSARGMCPAGTDIPTGESVSATTPIAVPTRPPFSCAPLPESFIFPTPAATVPGLYTRCASFVVGAATSVAMSPDGRLAALATTDGIVRVVEVATRQVVTVLASPRAMIDYVAFAPDGRAILTLARAQREVTLWQASDWTPATPVWTVALPGHRYDPMFGGGLGFAPDGRFAVASPGTGVFVLDVGKGAVVAGAFAGESVLDVAYGMGGSRIVVAQASMLAHCVHTPNGGRVVLLNADLQELRAIADFGNYPGWQGLPAFRVSPAEDQVIVGPGATDLPGLRAFRLSDGSALPPPALDALPMAFMPDGQSAVVNRGGGVQHVRVDDGSVLSPVMPGDFGGPISVSADGGVVALASGGIDLLRVWRPEAGGTPTPVCSAERQADSSLSSSLSADGQLLAFALGSSVRVVRRADGGMVMKLPANLATESARVELSPRGKYAAITPNWNADDSPAVVKLPAGSSVAVLTPDTSGWLEYRFTPAEDKLYSIGRPANDFTLDAISLATPANVTKRTVPAYTTLLGFSAGCPVLYNYERGAWRSCGGCDDAPVAGGLANQDLFGPANAVLSSDGMFVAVAGPYQGPGVTLWRMWPDPAALLTIGQRAGEAAFAPQEFPVAITRAAVRVLTGARNVASCYAGPEFEVHVHDASAGAPVLDALPPGVTSVDAAVRTIAYGSQLWCAR